MTGLKSRNHPETHWRRRCYSSTKSSIQVAPTQHLFVLIPHSPIAFHANIANLRPGRLKMASKTYDDPYRHTCLVPYVDPDAAPPEIASRIKVHSFRRNIFLTLAHSPGLFPHLMGVIGGCFQGKSRTVPLLDWVRETFGQYFLFGLLLGAIAKIVGLSNSSSYVSPPKSAPNTCTM